MHHGPVGYLLMRYPDPARLADAAGVEFAPVLCIQIRFSGADVATGAITLQVGIAVIAARRTGGKWAA
jgi:hypothetical protein